MFKLRWITETCYMDIDAIGDSSLLDDSYAFATAAFHDMTEWLCS